MSCGDRRAIGALPVAGDEELKIGILGHGRTPQSCAWLSRHSIGYGASTTESSHAIYY
jgi:hypothetical protein